MSRYGIGLVAISVLFTAATVGSPAQACHPKRGGSQGNSGIAARQTGFRGPLANFRAARAGNTTGNNLAGGVSPIPPAQPVRPAAATYIQPIHAVGPIAPLTNPIASPTNSPAPIKPPAPELAAAVPVATTNIATQKPEDTLADDASPSDKLPEVAVGSTVMLAAKDLGTTGQALLVIDKLTLGVQIDEWTADHATATLPKLAIRSPVPAEIVLIKADGQAASKVRVQLLPALDEQTGILATVASLAQ